LQVQRRQVERREDEEHEQVHVVALARLGLLHDVVDTGDDGLVVPAKTRDSRSDPVEKKAVCGMLVLVCLECIACINVLAGDSSWGMHQFHKCCCRS
jgi:hypothetical protein